MTSTKESMKDADGKEISEGSVLREINDNEQGVVIRIVRAGQWGTMFDSVGDMHIQRSPGSIRVSNRYNQWRHVPRAEQTYQERYLSWLKTPFDKECADMLYGEKLSTDAQVAINGILALLPEDAVCWEDGPWPDSIEQALEFLKNHLSEHSKP